MMRSWPVNARAARSAFMTASEPELQKRTMSTEATRSTISATEFAPHSAPKRGAARKMFCHGGDDRRVSVAVDQGCVVVEEIDVRGRRRREYDNPVLR